MTMPKLHAPLEIEGGKPQKSIGAPEKRSRGKSCSLFRRRPPIQKPHIATAKRQQRTTNLNENAFETWVQGRSGIRGLRALVASRLGGFVARAVPLHPFQDPTPYYP